MEETRKLYKIILYNMRFDVGISREPRYKNADQV